MKIESSDQDIRTVLSSAYYIIPRFQRPYSWEAENIQDFWDDVVKDGPSDYFIGSMVVFKEGANRYGVVDGQQRLTTITIFLAVLRNHLRELGFEDLAKGIQNVVERPNIDNKPEFILKTETSYPYFQDRVLAFDTTNIEASIQEEEESLQGAFDRLTELVASVVDSVSNDASVADEKKSELAKNKLIDIRDAILNLKVILIRLDDEDDAYIIFETLNTRGKDLELADLVKNYLAKQLKAKGAAPDAMKIQWTQLLETIQGSPIDLSVDTYIHHFWLSKLEYLPAKKVFKVLKKLIHKDVAQPFLGDLTEDAKLYRTIWETGYGKWTPDENRIRRALDALVLFKVQQPIPFVLSVLREFRSTKKIKQRHIEDALVAVEKFHFIFTSVTSQRSSGGISGMYALSARKLNDAKDTDEAVKVLAELKKKLSERIPSLAEFQALFPFLRYHSYFTKEKKLVTYVLESFHRSATVAEVVDYSQMTIEHLFPESSVNEEVTWGEVGQVGNLLLVSRDLNELLDNKDFAEKKKILVDAKYPLTEEILNAGKWGKEEIEARTASLAEQAYNDNWKI